MSDRGPAARRPRARTAAPYLFALPVFLYVSVLVLYPIGQGIATSLTRTELLGPAPPAWVGFANYRRLAGDPAFWRALRVTLTYTLLVVSATVVASVGTALLMNARFRGRALARAAITLPYAIPEVAAVLVWTWMLSQQFGVLNVFARGMLRLSENLPWLTDTRLALVSLLLLTLWKILPFYSLVVLTAFQALRAELYEAARIDGAGALGCFRHVTLPGIAPTLGLMTLLATIFSFRRFTLIYLLTGGGPADATKTLVVAVYEHAFRFFDLSYGSAIGTAGLGVTLLIAAAYFATQRRLGAEAA